MRNNANSSWPVGARKLLLVALATGAFLAAHTLLVLPAQAAPEPEVEICHIPPGDPANFHTITTSENAFAAHLAHGDLAGACSDTCATLCDDGNACGFDQTGNQSGVTEAELNLGPLANNGGPTMTHALGLLPTPSVAIDQIPLEDCVDTEGVSLMTDQRGVARPQGDLCDVGAFELEVAP